ncbi:DUF1801 domain-containing protein [Flavobacterium microcysteis]|uniref:DUF1801 domain-containing protein n=1 Tax=Flavobacterium microcysteis TaxID=2596891 RepID=A0A501Q2D4_9FLAO|nr:DUF1801 domain-containing protein [Flavobacterium microcysteis]TPD66091.1 DUF1801 domain-containing protein [Flavobacterium microcysteis]
MDILQEIDNFYLKQPEPHQSCLLALKDIILSQGTEITNVLKYGMPMFCYKQKMFCYLWVHKKYKQPYIGFVEGKHLDYPELLAEKRSRMKILLFDPNQDLPIEKIENILKEAIDLYKSGKIALKK